jgi:sorbitol/mannitol transport system permease protein
MREKDKTGLLAAAAHPLPVAGPEPAGHRRFVNTLPFIAPSVIALLAWIIIPLVLTLWFSVLRYNLLNPETAFVGLQNYVFLLTDPTLWDALLNTLELVGGVLIATVVFGTLFAVLFEQEFYGRGVARLLVIAPFFVMPTVSALVWKNLLMHPVNGLFAFMTHSLGLGVIDWFGEYPLLAVGIIVAWQWIPFATLILLTAMQSLDRDQLEAATMDGARSIARFFHITVPHLARPISVVVMIESIFLLSVFAEILVTTSGCHGDATTNLTRSTRLRYSISTWEGRRRAEFWLSCSPIS